MEDRQERPQTNAANVLRQLADRDQPTTESASDRRTVEDKVVRLSAWQKCGGGWRRKGKRMSD